MATRQRNQRENEMEVIKFIIFVLLLLAAWNYVILPSNLDASRDQLFDLRDELRSHFIKQQWDISSEKYGETRIAINSYLRFVDETSFWRLMYINFFAKKNRLTSTAKPLDQKHQPINKTSEMEEFLTDIRKRALIVVISHAVSSSFLLHVLAFSLLPFFMFSASIGAAKFGLNACTEVFTNVIRNFPSVASAGLALAEAYIGRKIFKESVVEQYSARYRYRH